jgi:hypothetical protein
VTLTVSGIAKLASGTLIFSCVELTRVGEAMVVLGIGGGSRETADNDFRGWESKETGGEWPCAVGLGQFLLGQS